MRARARIRARERARARTRARTRARARIASLARPGDVSHEPTRRRRSLSVLVVDDNPVDAKLVAAYLRRLPDRSVDVRTVASVEAALEALDRDLVDAVILDLTLPDASGLESISVLLAAHPALPIVVVTADDSQGTVDRALQAGAQDYLVKDQLKPASLARSLRYAVERGHYEHERATLVADLRERVKELSLLHSAARLLHEDRESVDELLAELVEMIPPAWLHPAVCCAEISFNGFRVATSNWRDTDWCLEATFDVREEKSGRVRVCYTEERSERDIGPFLHDEERALRSLAQMLRATLERREAHAEREVRDRELEAVATVADRLRTVESRAATADLVLDHLVAIFRATGAALVAGDVHGPWRVEAALGALTPAKGRRIKVTDDPTGEVLTRREARVTRAAPGDDIIGLRVTEPMTFAGVPVSVQEGPIGVLWVSVGPDDPCPSLELMSAVANISASALHRAGLLEGLEQRVADRTRDLAEANARLQELDALKSKFVSDVSHELRTPVTNLTLYISLLERGKPEKRDAYLATLKSQAARLTRLIEQILDLSRLDTGGNQMQLAPLDLNRLVRDVVVGYGAYAETSQLEIETELADDMPEVEGDASQLTQVVSNLVSNAINYTERGRVTVRTGQERGRGFVEVVDTGVGIPADELPLIFQRFYRGKQVGQSDTPGSGLGLAISKEIVERHGGTITVRSEIGSGSAFKMSLPRLQMRGVDVDEAE